MIRVLFLAAAMTGASLLASCGDQTAPDEHAGFRIPDLRTERQPDGAGARVTGGEVPFVFFFSDPETGLGVTAGFTPETLAAFCAAEPFDAETSTLRGVVRPDGSVTSLEQAKRVTIMVFFDVDQTFCDGEAPFAIGEGNYVNHDNDFFISGSRTNSFGFNLTGRVTDANGDPRSVSAAFQGTVDRNGDVQVARRHVVLR